MLRTGKLLVHVSVQASDMRIMTIKYFRRWTFASTIVMFPTSRSSRTGHSLVTQPIRHEDQLNGTWDVRPWVQQIVVGDTPGAATTKGPEN